MAQANDWRECGDELFAELRSKWLKVMKAIHSGAPVEWQLLPGLGGHLEPTRPPAPELAAAIAEYHAGKSSHLVDYLLSDRPVGRRERDGLAWAIGRNSKASPHRPANASLRYAATLAMAIYKEWRDRNQKAGITNHGHANEMKHAAALFVGATFFDVDEAAADELFELMNRSKKRREFTGGTVTLCCGVIAEISPKKCSHNS